MRGLVRPCRHRLGPDLQARWQAHLCGLCLTLRDTAGQTARLLTGFDTLLVSVLVEAQAGRQPTRTAGRCPLRGMRTAEVLLSGTPAMQLAAAGSLLAGSAGLRDKVTDHDLPYGTRAVAAAGAGRFEARGVVVATRVGLSPEPVLAAPGLAAELESRVGTTLDQLLGPTGRAVAELFGHTAMVAGVPDNVGPLRCVGDAYGRLVHLLDAVEDRADDDRAGGFNPLTVTGTTTSEAHQLARRLAQRVAEGMAGVVMVDPDLAEVLLGPELERAVSRTFRAGSAHLAVAGVLTAVTLFGFPRGQRRKRQRDESRCGDFADCCCPCDCGDCGVLDSLACDCMDCCDCAVCDCC